MSHYHYVSHLWNALRSSHITTHLPYTTLNLQISSVLLSQGFITSLSPGTNHAPATQGHTPRLWLTLKPETFSNIKTVSKPSRRVFAKPAELQRLRAGKFVQRLQWLGLKQPLLLGEVVVVRSDVGVVDAGEAVERRLGGEVLFTVS